MEGKQMIFEGLEIKQDYVRQGDGNYKYLWVGKFHVKTKDGSVLWIKITPELCQNLINVCADHIVETAETACQSMKSAILESIAQPLEIKASK